MRFLALISLVLFAFQSIGQSETVSILLKQANGFLTKKTTHKLTTITT